MSDQWKDFRDQLYKDEPIDEPITLFPEIIPGQTIGNVHLPLPKEIISGLLSQGEKGELAGGSKSFKTWALIQQSLCIAAGLPWWQCKTHQTNVIFLNLEIPRPFFEARVRVVASALGIKVPETFHVWHLRSAKLGDLSRWGRFLTKLKENCAIIPEPYLTSDPIYKLLGGRNENAAGDVQLLLEQLDDMINLVNGANFFGHHYSKGNQAAKDAIDRAAGSGVFQRDPDTILTMTPHEKEGCFSIDAILRNHPPIESFVVQWDYPLFIRDDSSNPTDLKTPKNPATQHFNPKMLHEWIGHDCIKTKELQRRLHDETGMSERTFYNMLAKAKEQKLIVFDGQTKTWERNGALQ